MKTHSPVTKSENVKKINSYPTSITSDGRLLERSVDNFICLDSGLIFNSTGARGKEEDFYSEDYDLHSESTESEFRYFESEESVGFIRILLNLLRKIMKQKEILTF